MKTTTSTLDATALVQLAESIGGGRSTLDELNHLQELLERAETVKAAMVTRARNEGSTWQEIAHNIGGTKQAAQQRYGKEATR